jgi:phosphoglycerate dehydrogenase-like enzyme
MKAFIFDPLWDELITNELSVQLDRAGVELVVTKEIAPLADCKALFEGNEERILCINPDYVKWKLSAKDYRSIPNLKGIFGAATATHWIDKSYANENNIPICDIKNFSTEAVAEWATMMMLSVARQTPNLIKSGFPLDFDKDYMKYRGIELHGKTAGIIGLGHNGSAIAKRCSGLGMNVVYWSRASSNDAYQKLELSELMSTADVIFPAFDKNDETNVLLTDQLLESLKPTAIIIDIIELKNQQEKILQMVQEGKLFGYGFEAEPGSFSDYQGNVWAAPAYAWATDQTMHNAMVKWVENMTNAAVGKFPNRVN